MSKFKSQGFGNTFKNARKGMRIVLKSERNIRIHFVAAIFVLILGFVLEFSALKISVLLLAIGLVVAAEMLNSAIEFSLDAIFHNRYSKMVGMAKDISARCGDVCDDYCSYNRRFNIYSGAVGFGLT